MDVFIAISAPSSAVAGFWFFETVKGHLIWQGMTFIATGLAVTKPFMKFSSKIKKFEQALSGYRAMYCDLDDLLNKCVVDQAYSKAAQKMFDAATRKKRSLLQATPESTQDKNIIEKCMLEVEQEIPHETFFIPKDSYGN